MKIGVAGTIFTHKNISKVLWEKTVNTPQDWSKTFLEILHSYGARETFLLFHDNQDTDSESREIEMSISQPISGH